MEDFTQMLKRAHIQQLRSFLMDGTGLDNWYEDEDSRPYGQRLEEEERPIWKLLDKLTGALAANQSVFLEIGLRAGAVLLFDLLRENPEGNGYLRGDSLRNR